MVTSLRACAICAAATFSACGLASAQAAVPTVEQALKLAPVHDGVDYDRPKAEEVTKCTVKGEKTDGRAGWVVRGQSGQILRRFVDTNSDDVVDLWCYYLGGVEAYRDIDSDFNNKADQARWLNSQGSRWGVDTNEDGKIDAWRFISAEEVTSELVSALVESDQSRFERLLLTDAELNSLGLGDAKLKELTDKIQAARSTFADLVRANKTFKDMSWIDFGGVRPSAVPAGTEGMTKDLLVYENVVAMVETKGQHGQLQVGTLVQVGASWRLIDAPVVDESGDSHVLNDGNFVRPAALTNRPGGGSNDGDDPYQKHLAELQQLDEEESAAGPDKAGEFAARRCDLLEKIVSAASTPEERGQWVRNLADSLSAAALSGAYPEGVERLKKLQEDLSGADGDADAAAYAEFRYLTAKYTLDVQQPNSNFAKIQADWLENLKKFAEAHPKSLDAAEAMLQLAISEESAGQEEEARKWYSRIADDLPEAPSAAKAAGAIRRLDCVGKPIELKGMSTANKSVDITQYRGKRAVLIHYWETKCEPCIGEFAQLKELQAKYGAKDLAIIGVSLDARREDLVAYLRQNPLPWPQLFDEGGLDSRFANEMGILSLPTMILVDRQGKVVHRSIHVSEVDREMKAIK